MPLSSRRSAGRLLLAALMVTTMADDVAAQFGTGGPASNQSLLNRNRDKKPEVLGLSLSATGEEVVELRIVGNKTIPTTQIINQLQTKAGRPFDPKIVQRDIRKLSSLSWFVEVKPLYEKTDAGRVVIFEVVERPTIRYVEYLGNQRIRDKTLTKEIGLKVGGSVDPFAVEDGRRKMLALYTRNGFNKTQVSILEGNKPTDQGVVYVINEGVSQRVWKTEFVGANFVSERRLRTKVKSKRPTAFLFGGFVDHDQIDADVQTITDYYRAFGFYQAKVGRDIDFNENGTWATITFAINEGPRYEVRNVQFMGNQLFADSSLAMGIKMPAGHPFERAKMQADIEWLKELYGSQGYVFADIRAEPVLLEQPGQLDLVYHMEEGKRWRVGRVLVNVNGDHPHTRIQTALNRLSIEPGEVIDIREVRASERRLQASGLFLSDPISGTSPRITFQIPELDSVEFSAGRGPNDAGIRGQSPDAANRQQFAPPPMATTPAGAPPLVTTPVAAPPVIAPPSAAKHWHEISRPPAGNADDYVDIYIDVVTPEPVAPPATPPVVAPTPSEQTLSPSATIHTVMRPPYDQPVAYGTQITQPQYPVQQQVASQQYSPQQPYPAQQQYSAQTYPPQQQPQQAYTYAGQNGQPAVAAANSATPTPTQWPAPTQPAVASTWSSPAGGSNPYDNYTVRTQSPYQPAAATPQPPATTGFGGQAGYGVQAAYGGQVPGALGPQAAPVGHNGDVQQVQYTETLPPPGYGTQGDGPVMGAAGQTQGYSNQVVTPLPGDPVYPQGIPFAPVQAFPDPAVDVIVDVAEAPTGRFQIGAGINSDAGVVGTISLDERNFDWRKPPTSMNDFATGRAWRGGGQHLRLEAAPGTQVQRYLASWQEPYFLDTRVSFGLSGSFYERRFRDWDEERVGGRVSTGYQWVEHDLSASLAYRGENVNINDVPVLIPQLAEVLGDNALHGFSLRVANDTRDSAFFPTDGHLIDLQVEQVVGSFEYPRAILDIREYGLIRERPDHSGRHVISASSKIGYTGDDTPIYENFFAGGFSTLRGFDFRGASPVFMGVEVGGRFQWINTLEYLFPLTADDMMHGVVFVDFGTVESDIDELDIKRVRIAPGVGLRITVPAMGPAPIALDFAWGIERAATDDLQVFSFNVGYLR